MSYQHIAKIEEYIDNEDYYDLSVENTHNYVLANGLVVHNCGVGFSVQNHHIEKLPPVIKSTKTKRYLIGDSIEGWADAVKTLMKSYFANKPLPLFDFGDIRNKGALLITAGGRAPGPEPLKDCLHNIKKILDRKENGDQLTSLEAHDIMCYIADAVLSGGIRRAAMISLFDIDDDEMLTCKFGEWYIKNPQRGRANNSAVIVKYMVEEQVFFDLWKKIEKSGSGEPGFFFTNDPNWGLNPCVTGDTLVYVKDHGAIAEGTMLSDGTVYQIPMKMLVDLYETSDRPPMIVSYNLDTKTVEYDYLDAAALTRKKTDILELEMEDGTVLKLTPDHKVWTETRGWIQAKDLTDNDTILKLE